MRDRLQEIVVITVITQVVFVFIEQCQIDSSGPQYAIMHASLGVEKYFHNMIVFH